MRSTGDGGGGLEAESPRRFLLLVTRPWCGGRGLRIQEFRPPRSAWPPLSLPRRRDLCVTLFPAGVTLPTHPPVMLWGTPPCPRQRGVAPLRSPVFQAGPWLDRLTTNQFEVYVKVSQTGRGLRGGGAESASALRLSESMVGVGRGWGKGQMSQCAPDHIGDLGPRAADGERRARLWLRVWSGQSRMSERRAASRAGRTSARMQRRRGVSNIAATL